MIDLTLTDVTVRVGHAVLADQVSLRIGPGELCVLLGPNGAGKTSLLRAAVGLEAIARGSAKIGSDDSVALSATVRAQRLSYLPQTRPLAWPNRVRDIVALGRYAYGASLARLDADDAMAVNRAMDACDIAHLADRKTDTLSGGELARVHFARAFAAETPLLVADEPVAALDPRHQYRIMDLIKSYVSGGGGALIVLHDINLAARYADRMIWMREGRIVADGSPEQTLTPERIAEVYEMRARLSGLTVEMEGPV